MLHTNRCASISIGFRSTATDDVHYELIRDRELWWSKHRPHPHIKEACMQVLLPSGQHVWAIIIWEACWDHHCYNHINSEAKSGNGGQNTSHVYTPQM